MLLSLSEGVEKTARVLPQSFLWVQGPETAMLSSWFSRKMNHCGNRRSLLPHQLLLRPVAARTHQPFGQESAEGQKKPDSRD